MPKYTFSDRSADICVDLKNKHRAKHTFYTGSHTRGEFIGVSCKYCYWNLGEILANKTQAKAIKKWINTEFKDRTLYKLDDAWKKIQSNWEKSGKGVYDLMLKARAFAKKYPDSVTIVNVDDDWFASSDLVFIDNISDRTGYWGTTVVYLPQCTGEKPIKFFMYPGHTKGLIKALQGISKKIANNKPNPTPDPIKRRAISMDEFNKAQPAVKRFQEKLNKKNSRMLAKLDKKIAKLESID